MDLSPAQRLILWNQHEILKQLDSESADYHERMQDIYQSGYEFDYPSDFIYDPAFPKSESLFVIRVLAMYEALQDAAKELPSTTGVSKGDVTFPGFAGNTETMHMAYARFLVEDMKKFTHLNIPSFDGHIEAIPVYRRMLEVWNAKDQKRSLSEDDVVEILEARGW